MSESPSERIIDTIAAKRDIDAIELPLLYDVIDPDSLNRLIGSMDDGAVSFTYAGYEIVVTSDGAITLAEPTVSNSPSCEANCDD
ncbi:HalOD1 output domain-containing protein [Halobacterium sp. R2-5]|uniref:HalOD1 output domain-containing protein n=1 Tax=Halobacterium sp. R2-5 TaxID=2715751 RepID=UPI001420C089|nr:HalOD1 output domain-containing protein [Halobacterium sp. R2-5]NIC00996.1 hypothetical protein [Halobacterium sp. R2-5]